MEVCFQAIRYSESLIAGLSETSVNNRFIAARPALRLAASEGADAIAWFHTSTDLEKKKQKKNKNPESAAVDGVAVSLVLKDAVAAAAAAAVVGWWW